MYPYVFQSRSAAQMWLWAKSSAVRPWRSAIRRRCMRIRSSADRNRASSGQSNTIHQHPTPTSTVAMPSRMKIHAQPGRPATPSMSAMAAASSPPNEPASAAAEKKMADRTPISDDLYQQLR